MRRFRMRRFPVVTLGLLAIVAAAGLTNRADATVIQPGLPGTMVQEIAGGGYATPLDGNGNPWATVLSEELVGLSWTSDPLNNQLRSDAWYQIGLQDWMVGGELNLVFEGIYNNGSPSDIPDDILNVYVYDNEPNQGRVIYSGEDASSTIYPDWIAMGAVFVGGWTDDDDDPLTPHDVIYHLDFSHPALAAFLNGGTFGIAVDPDCAYSFDRMLIQTPIPEPTTMVLLGSGLVGLAGLARKRRQGSRRQ